MKMNDLTKSNETILKHPDGWEYRIKYNEDEESLYISYMERHEVDGHDHLREVASISIPDIWCKPILKTALNIIKEVESKKVIEF